MVWSSVCDCPCLLAMLDEDDEDRVDEQALQQLTEMGFPESRAIKALRLNQWVEIWTVFRLYAQISIEKFFCEYKDMTPQWPTPLCLKKVIYASHH